MRCFMSSAEGIAPSVEDRRRPLRDRRLRLRPQRSATLWAGPDARSARAERSLTDARSGVCRPRGAVCHCRAQATAILWKVLEPSKGADAMITITDKGAEKVHEFLDGQQADV